MPNRNCTILEQAFVGMVTSALEVYKKESYGVLLGEIHKHHYLIADSYTFQSAKRTYETVDIKAHRINRVNEAFCFFTKCAVIADFHSHPEGPHKLSPWDRKDLMKTGLPVTVLVSVYKVRKARKWERDEHGGISGTIGNKYLVKMKAYELNKKTKKFHQIKIVSPYIRKINNLRLYRKRR